MALNARSFNGDSCIHNNVWKCHLRNSFLLVQMVIKTDFSSSILFFRKQEREFSQTNNIDNCPFISQWWSWNIRNLDIWIIRCLIVFIVFIYFISCLNISDFVLPITWSKVLIKSQLAHMWEYPFPFVLAFDNLSDPVFDIILAHKLCN